jgi:hypothetical protein
MESRRSCATAFRDTTNPDFRMDSLAPCDAELVAFRRKSCRASPSAQAGFRFY